MSDAASSSQLDSAATVTTVPVSAKRTVTYEFDTRATNADLAIPYVVIVNGKVPAPDKPRKLSKENRKIQVTVDTGSKVALHLNSDVHPDYRRNPVYEVEVDDHNVVVTITEQKGGNSQIQPAVGPATLCHSTNPGGPATKRYTAKLTGDIWMTISHRYTEAEANALVPTDTEPVIRKAVGSIYRGLGGPKLDIPYPADAGFLHVSFINQGNPQANISRCSLLDDVLPRTHPCAYAALFSVAYKVGLSEVHITSCWRPSLGSIVHRAGLGLDVDLIANLSQRIEINRDGLESQSPSRNPNVTDREKAQFSKCEDSTKAASKAPQDKDAEKAAAIDCTAWEDEMKKNEPKLMQELRKSLRAQSSVRQILDPWYIELNTKDPRSPSANRQRSGNEKIHKDHLHITIKEPKIYE